MSVKNLYKKDKIVDFANNKVNIYIMMPLIQSHLPITVRPRGLT